MRNITLTKKETALIGGALSTAAMLISLQNNGNQLVEVIAAIAVIKAKLKHRPEKVLQRRAPRATKGKTRRALGSKRKNKKIRA